QAAELGAQLGARRPQEVHPGPEGQGLVALVALADEDPAASTDGFDGGLRDQPALADPRFPSHQDGPRVPRPGRVEGRPEQVALGRATREGHLRERGRGRRVLAAWRRARVGRRRVTGRGRWAEPLTQDLLVDLPRLGLGLYLQLAPEHGDALPVLAER